MTLTVTMPSGSIPYQMVGSKIRPGPVAGAPTRTDRACPSGAYPSGAYPSTATAPAIWTRNSRRDEPRSLRLGMAGPLPDAAGGELDRPTNSKVRHAAAQVPAHHRVDVAVRRLGIVLEQRARLHDLPWLAVAALGDLKLAPGSLQGVLALRVQPLDGGDAGAGHRAE